MRANDAPSVAALLLAAGCGGASRSTPPSIMDVPEATVRFLVGGDSRDDAAHVLPWAFREAKARHASAFLFLGDMELSPQLDAHFRRELDLCEVPFYPVLGNHEVRVLGLLSIGQAQAERAFRARFLDTPRTRVKSSLDGRIVYSVNLPGGVHFVALDNVSMPGFGQEQLAWLTADLDQARADRSVRHIVIGMHKPLAKNGVSTHGMDMDGVEAVADSDVALALFVESHVSLILASHVHQYEHFEQRGIPTYVTGGLGAPLTPSGPAHAFHHFLVLDVTDGGIGVDVVRFDGTPNIGTDEVDD